LRLHATGVPWAWLCEPSRGVSEAENAGCGLCVLRVVHGPLESDLKCPVPARMVCAHDEVPDFNLLPDKIGLFVPTAPVGLFWFTEGPKLRDRYT
jgi:hypothetical protein